MYFIESNYINFSQIYHINYLFVDNYPYLAPHN